MLQVSRQKNAFALAKTIWFDDVGRFAAIRPCQILDEVVSEVCTFSRQNPCLWKEVVLCWKVFLHLHQVASHLVFASYAAYSRVHVDFLPRVQL